MNQVALNKILKTAEELCQKNGVRLTEQRRQVLEIVCNADKPLGAYDILDGMRKHVKAAAPTTVYRALDFLLEQGLVHKLETIHAYVGCNHPEHPHSSQFLICVDCGIVTELEDPEISQSLKNATSAIDFTVGKGVVEVVGTCSLCTTTAK